MIFIIIYIYSYVYLCIYTPSYQHFKAFTVSKFDSETTFQGEFKFHRLKAMQRNFIVYIFMIFMLIFIYSYVYLCIYTPSYQHFKSLRSV